VWFALCVPFLQAETSGFLSFAKLEWQAAEVKVIIYRFKRKKQNKPVAM